MKFFWREKFIDFFLLLKLEPYVYSQVIQSNLSERERERLFEKYYMFNYEKWVTDAHFQFVRKIKSYFTSTQIWSSV